MRTILLQKVAQLNEELDVLFTALEKHSLESLNTQPSATSWSVIQILHHLMLSEKYSIAYCSKKLSFKPKLKQAGILSSIRTKLVQFYLNSPLKFKAPKIIDSSALPTEGTLEEAITKWKNQRKEMIYFFENVPEEYLNVDVYKHPFGGRLSLAGMLDFLKAHFNNHRKQIGRVFAALETK